MENDFLPPQSKKFFPGLFIGLLLGCILGIMLGISKKSSSVSDVGIKFTENPKIVSTPSFIVTRAAKTSFLSIAETLTPVYTVTSTELPSPMFMSIPLTSCGDHIAYSARADTTEIPIVENDKIIEYATHVRVTYKINNTYVNMPIYGFEIHPSPGYTNPAIYPHKSQVFVGDPLIQPNEEVILKSEHLFVPDNWSFDKHPNTFWKFPEGLRFHPYPYESEIGGYTVFFQIFEMFAFSKPDELRCDGAIQIKQ